MILDTSAILAIAFRESDAAVLAAKMAAAPAVGVGGPTLVEAGVVLTARLGADGHAVLAGILRAASVVVVPFGAEHWQVAVDAHARFGKGRHPAALNFGDCLAYATARVARRPLLCKGSDFARTDLALA